VAANQKTLAGWMAEAVQTISQLYAAYMPQTYQLAA